nr:flagellar hook-basal body complex protein FliE [Methylobacter sp. S3L5C]
MRSAVATVHAPGSQVIEGQAKGGVDFGQVFKAQMDQVNGLHQNAQKLGERFSLGDDSVNLSDVMIASQKSSIAMQTTIQARNKLVTAYHDIMNMQV